MNNKLENLIKNLQELSNVATIEECIILDENYEALQAITKEESCLEVNFIFVNIPGLTNITKIKECIISDYDASIFEAVNEKRFNEKFAITEDEYFVQRIFRSNKNCLVDEFIDELGAKLLSEEWHRFVGFIK